MRQDYVPQRGDVIWLSFSPQAGREQAGRRPGIVLSPDAFNRRVGLALTCPVTSRIKGYPFEVRLEGVHGLSGVILVDQLRSLDWRAREAERAGRAPAHVLADVLARLRPLLGM
ncbi:MAG TPA: endoribonuclease MazF [Geminicoccaceae bacterium]|nr:endoribonuclease MazF [Geminicoccaceae bacterium]